MNQKRFTNIVLVLAVIVIAGAVAYLTLVKKPTTQPISVGQPQAQNQIFSASPASGAAPLTVNFSISATDSSDSSGVYYTVVFGDGEAGGFPRTKTLVLSHTYNSPGTYSAVATRMTQCSSWECIGPSAAVGTVTITVRQ